MSNKNDYLPRLIDKEIDRYLQTFGALCIEGPKWSGKTWTSLHHAKSEMMLGDPSGDFQNRQLAQMSPSLVLEGESPRLLDEWQEVPSLWDAVRARVDFVQEKGQFILTSSATPNHKGILHSGAGRIARLRMRPMSLFESNDSSGEVSLEALCHGQLQPVMTGEVDLRHLIGLILRGGWPGSLRIPKENYSLIPQEYLKAVINDDSFRIDGIKRDTGKMWLLLKSLARNESTTATKKKLRLDILDKDDQDLSPITLSEYLDIFRRLFLTENQEPFSASGLRSALRIKQAEKLHFVDPSLACALLGATESNLLGDLNTLGFLFEALCERDLRIYAESFGGKLYHYQDYANQELDAVVVLPDGQWTAFEIKLGANQIDEAAANLLRVRDQLAKDPKSSIPNQLVVLCGMSHAAYKRPDGVFVVPITALKP